MNTSNFSNTVPSCEVFRVLLAIIFELLWLVVIIVIKWVVVETVRLTDDYGLPSQRFFC